MFAVAVLFLIGFPSFRFVCLRCWTNNLDELCHIQVSGAENLSKCAAGSGENKPEFSARLLLKNQDESRISAKS